MGPHPIFESDFDCLTVNSDKNTSPWVFRVTQNTSTALPAGSAPRPARSACFSWVAPPPRPSWHRTASTKCALAAATLSTVLSVWIKVTSHGPPRPVHARCVSLTSSTTPPTTSWSVPRPSSRAPSSPLTLPFRQWYEAHYAKALGRKKNAKLTEEEQKTISGPRSANSQKKIDERR